MGKPSVPLLAELSEVLKNRLEILRRRHQQDRAFPVSLPPDEALCALLEETFWASIMRDEGTECEFVMAYHAEAPVVGILFQPPKALDRGTLRRLAAVASSAEAEIVVSWINNGFVVVGFDHKVFRRHRLTQRRVPLKVEVNGPGHLVVRYGPYRIVTCRDGDISKPGPNVFDAAGPFRAAISAMTERTDLPSERVLIEIKSLLDQIAVDGHGGLLIIATDAPKGIESTSWPIGNEVLGLADLYRSEQENQARFAAGLVVFNEAADFEESLSARAIEVRKVSASLCQTDGALWLDATLRPRGFGLFSCIQRIDNVLQAADAAGSRVERMPFGQLGSRHRAAVSLAQQNPGCPVIAASVDGGFTAALRVEGDDEVRVWRFHDSDMELDDPFNVEAVRVIQERLRRLSSQQT